MFYRKRAGAAKAARLPAVRLSLVAIAVAFGVRIAIPVGSLFPEDYSTLVYDSGGRLLRATLAGDEQYRFPPDEGPLPEKYVTALVASEDKRFFSHPGVDPFALAKAVYTNIRAGRRIRGGSTITMQVVRLADPRPRTYVNKLGECLEAIRLSLHCSKKEILALYARNVPLGGNVVGIEAAAHLYFGRPADELTWAEASLLVVLPNSPSMINLERARARLLEKRNDLLGRLLVRGIIDSITCAAARSEPLPGAGARLPFDAPHFTTMILAGGDAGRGAGRGGRGAGKDRTRDSSGPEAVHRIETTIDRGIQRRVSEAARLHHAALAGEGIENVAVLVAETRSGEVRAYVGSQDFFDAAHGGQVDGVRAYRSTGSLLKPFLIALALDRGPYTIASRIQDVPTYYGTFVPQNATEEFCGLASLERVLIESLNVPAVRLLNAYGLGDFYDFLVQAGLRGLFRSPDRYGLPLVIGGAEASLFELVQLYLSLGSLGEARPLRAVEGERGGHSAGARLFSEGSAWLVLDVLRRLSRPGVELYRDRFDGGVPAAWKTGTSYGQKDAWAIGVNAQWTIGVWAGNFSGEGNAALSGARSAAPLLFTLFNALSRRDEPMWFEEPLGALEEIACCAESGYPAGPYCSETVTVKCPRGRRRGGTCPYHARYLVDAKTGRSVCSLCWSGVETRWDTIVVVPPAVREILARNGRRVGAVPAHAAHCPSVAEAGAMELVYPVDGIKIFVPRDFGGEHERVVFSAKHQRPSEHLFWFLDGSLIGETVDHHELPVDLDAGSHRLTVEDQEGCRRSVSFTAYRRES